ncbi:MAG TPA: Crp/Fnr family transcriptional regulator [Campylobacterales bacterium]|nr:Crp/Fnr family transcriptional regulator [Campylobacterales bacterium]
MQNKSTITILSEMNMFVSLNEEELESLASICHISEYKEGANLFLKGDVLSSLMLLIDGIVSVFKHDNKGNEIVIGYFTRYKFLAEAATLRHTELPSSATFKSDGAILKIDLAKFEELFMSNPQISYAMIQSLLHKIDLLQQNIHFNIASNSSEKILFFYKQNPKLSLDLKQYEIASILGMVAETFSRNVKKLVNEGKLEKISTGYKII